MIYRYTFLLACCCSSLLSWAQSETTLPSMRGLYQSTYVNPAFAPKYKVSIGLPVISNFNATNTRSGFTLQDVFDCVDEDSLIDFNKFYNKIQGEGIAIQTTLNTDLFHVSFPVGKFQLSVNSSFKSQNTQVISKEFIGFLANGNAYFAGKTQEVKLVNVNATSYLENGFSVSRQFGKFGVGVRAKYLQGVASVESQDLGFSIKTGENAYDSLTIRTKGSLRTAGVPLFVDSVTNQQKNDDLKKFDAATLTKFANSGFGLDLGLTYQATKWLMVHASVVDWGGINWKSNPYNYELGGKDVTFGGFSNDDFDSDSTRNAYTDSLTKLLYEATVTTESFKTKLLTRYYAGFDVNLSKRDRFGFLYQGQQYTNKMVSAITLSYAHRFGRGWDLSANYSNYDKKYTQVGVGTALKMGPVQLYLITDDIMILFKPNDYNFLSFRMGINLVFGADDAKQKVKKGDKGEVKGE
jgi:hypothetical protein